MGAHVHTLASDAKIVRSRDAQCNTKQSPQIKMMDAN